MNDAPYLVSEERTRPSVATVRAEFNGFNGWIAVKITNGVGTMWCAYAFTALTLLSLPDAIRGGKGPLISWIAQTFLQLVLLSIIMVGQRVAAIASDKQALQTYKDAEALLDISSELHKLLKINNSLTEDIHERIGWKNSHGDDRTIPLDK